MKKCKNIIVIIFLFTLILSTFSFSINALSTTGSSYLNTLESKFTESSSYRALIKKINIQENTAELHFNNGEVLEFEIASDAVLVSQNRIQNISDFNMGDSVIALIDTDEKIKFMESINHNLINELNLEDLGYNDNILLKENKAEISFFFPINEKVMIADSVLNYYLKFSPLLREESTINIEVENQILFSSSLAEIKNNHDFQKNNTAVVTLPLSELNNLNLTNKDLINSTINADLKISDNRCDDINNSSLWMSVLNKSQIEFKYKTFADYDINEFFIGNFNDLNIYLPENINEATAESLLKLRIYLSRNFQHLNISLLQKPDLNNNYLNDFNTRNIFIENQSQKIELDHNLNLFLGAESTAAFIDTASEIFAVDKININSFTTNNTTSEENYLSLGELGYSTLQFRGIGEITKTINFTTADLGRLPENIRLVLNGVYTPPQKLKTVENINSYLKIYLNQELIKVHQLNENGKFDNLPVELPSNLLNQENSLSFVYSYYPIGSDCAADGQYFEGTIADSSYLELKGNENEEYIDFDNILTQFSSSGILLLPENNRFFYLKNAAEALAAFRKLDQQPINIAVGFINKNTAFEFSEEDNWVFAVLPTSDYLNLNIPFKNIDEQVEVQSTLNENDEQLKEKFFIEAEIYNEFASWQLFKRNSRAYSIISASNESSNAQKQIENLSSSVNNTAAFRNLEGNLLISSNNKLHKTSLFKDKDEIVINQWKIFYQKYRLIILVLMLVIILIAAYWIYKNMARMPEDK